LRSLYGQIVFLLRKSLLDSGRLKKKESSPSHGKKDST